MKVFLLVLRLTVFCLLFVPKISPAQAANSAPDEWPFELAISKSGHEGIVALETFLRDYPNSPHREKALEALISLYEADGDEDDTRTTAQRLLHENPDNPKAKAALNFEVLVFRGPYDNKTKSRGEATPTTSTGTGPTTAQAASPRPGTGTTPKTEAPTSDHPVDTKVLTAAQDDQPKRDNPTKNVESDHTTTIATALIAALATILAAYWQFVYKPRQSSGSRTSSQRDAANSPNSVLQAPVINVSPSFNFSPGNTDLDIKLKEQTLRQNELAAETNSCRQIVLTMVNEAKKKHGQNNLAFSDEQLRDWAGQYSPRLHAVMDALATEGRAHCVSPGLWTID